MNIFSFSKQVGHYLRACKLALENGEFIVFFKFKNEINIVFFHIYIKHIKYFQFVFID